MGLLSQFAHVMAADYYNDYSSYSTYGDGYTSGDAAAAAVIGGAMLLFIFIFGLIAYAVHAFLLGRIFKKAGVESWIAWVPFYNGWKLLEIGGQQGFWAILVIIPFVNIVSAVFTFIAMHNIGLKLQKESWFVLLAIFLPIVWMIWLAFDDSKWAGNKAVATAKVDESQPAATEKTADTETKK